MPVIGVKNPAFLAALGIKPFLISDDFNRVNSSDLGSTPVGNVAWQKLSGGWSVSSNRLVNTSGSNPVVVVDGSTPNVEVQLDISSTGRDAIIFRCSNASNWWRLANYYTQTHESYPTYGTEYEWRQNYRHSLSSFCNTSGTPHWDNISGDRPPDTELYAWGTSSVSPPSFPDCANSSFHTHTTQSPDTGPFSHTHPQAKSGSPVYTGNTRQVSTGTNTTTTTTRRLYIHKSVNGSINQIYVRNVSSTSRLRVVVNGNTISVYYGSGTSLGTTITDSFNNAATLHGVGRGTLGDANSAMDNFVLTPIL